MAFRFFGPGKITRKSDLAYSPEGKPYIFFSVETPKQFVRDGGKATETHDIAVFGQMAEEFDGAVKVEDHVTVLGFVQRRKKKDDTWEESLLLDEIQVGDRFINWQSSKK